MITTKSSSKTYGVTNYHAERPVHVAPQIEKEYRDKDGERMYKGVNGKHYRADAFDAMFKVIPGEIRKKGFKGENACYRLAVLQ